MNKQFNEDATAIKLYRNPLSGHCHRVELMLSLLDLPYEAIDLDMANGAHKAPDYLKLSPLGQVPAIDDNGLTLSDSNAIITYLVTRYGSSYNWIPENAVEAAEVQRWLSIAAGEIAYGPCAVRLVKLFGMSLDYELAKEKTLKLFEVVEATLSTNDYLIGDQVSLADIAAYSYIAHVPEGGISLAPYPSIRSWIARIEAIPGFIPMLKSPVPDSSNTSDANAA